MESPKKFASKQVLIVGAGAIGQVYGHALKKGGCVVGVLVRPHHQQKVEEEGYYLHRLGLQGRKPGYENFKPEFVYTSTEEITGIWNEVWICTPSDTVYEPWFADLMQRLTPGSTLVLTGNVNLDYIAQWIPKDRVVSILVSMVSYPGPLPGETETYWPQGMVYYLPPFGPTLVGSENSDRASETVRLLINGGLPAKQHSKAMLRNDSGSALLMPFVAGLELEGWSFDQFRDSTTLAVFLASYCQLVELAYKRHNAKMGWVQKKIINIFRGKSGPKAFAFLLNIAPSLVPFPLETYLKFHFTKVRKQTGLVLQEQIQDGQKLGVDMAAVSLLLSHWKKLPAPVKTQEISSHQPAGLVGVLPTPQGQPLPVQQTPQRLAPASASGSMQIPVAPELAAGLEEDTDPPGLDEQTE